MTAPVAAVRMTGISKSFGGVRALDKVDLEVLPGEVHALLGGNGAGKSTILKVLNGVHVPDEGTVEVAGQRLAAPTPEAARAAGVAMNFQEMSLIPTLTVAQNVFLTREARDARGLIDDEESIRRAEAIFAMLEVEVNPRALVGDLGAGQRQLTEIAKAISQDARVLILDEPSTALAVSDVERLFVFLRKLTAKGVAIIYVSHRMDEIARIADRATILRDGRHVITASMADLPIDTMIEHIVGKRSKGLADVVRGTAIRGEALLELNTVTGPHKPDRVSFTLHRGEVLGLAGLLGSGRSALARVVAGIEPAVSGEIRIKGTPVQIRSPADAIAAGIAYVSEDRRKLGLAMALPIRWNISLATLKRYLSRLGLIDVGAETDMALSFRKRLNIRTPDVEMTVGMLSGGNQQKVMLAKWLNMQPDLLIVDEPTRGIDVGSKAEVHDLIRAFAAGGGAVLVVSSDLPEVLAMGDRILVMREGQQMAILDSAEASQERIMALATGQRGAA